MKSRLLASLLLVVGVIAASAGTAGAQDTNWMQPGVRLWYLGAVDTGGIVSSNAEESYLIDAVAGTNVHVVKHSALNQWKTPNPAEVGTWPMLGMSPYWIHPARLQTLKSGDYWMDQEIRTVVPTTGAALQFKFLPVKALLALNPARVIVKITYMIDYFSTGTAFIDADTGIILYYDSMWGSNKMFFALAEINYDFARHAPFPEVNGPHTGFMSTVSELSNGIGFGTMNAKGGGAVELKSQVETRYGNTVEMRVKTTITAPSWPAGTGRMTMADENYCFFGDVPIVRRMDATQAPSYPPEQWNAFGHYLWWWLPGDTIAVQAGQSLNVYDVVMAKTADVLPTYTATQSPQRFYFNALWFDSSGYLKEFWAKDPTSGLDLMPGQEYYRNLTTVDGRTYYETVMAPGHFFVAPVVAQHPASQTVNARTAVTFTAAASGTPTPTVQWQVRPNSTAAWTDIGGATSATYVFVAADADTGKQFRAVFSNGGGAAPTNAATLTVLPGPPPSWTVPFDLTGDGKSDVVWHHATRGEVWLWPMDGTSRTATTFVQTQGDARWEIRAVRDMTGDAMPDILWRHKTTGEISLCPMNGSTPGEAVHVATIDPAYDIVGTGDFNGDGQSDLLWRHLANGEVWIWLMNGATPMREAFVGSVDPSYVIKGVGDLDDDSKADIVWHHATRGEVWVWLMDGTTPVSRTFVAAVPDTGYQIKAVADFTGDGKADVLWHHATRGEVWVWTMDGARLSAASYVWTVPDTRYRIVSAGDYNGDGTADVLWHHATLGEVWVWLMAGPHIMSQTFVAAVPDVGYVPVAVK